MCVCIYTWWECLSYGPFSTSFLVPPIQGTMDRSSCVNLKQKIGNQDEPESLSKKQEVNHVNKVFRCILLLHMGMVALMAYIHYDSSACSHNEYSVKGTRRL